MKTVQEGRLRKARLPSSLQTRQNQIVEFVESGQGVTIDEIDAFLREKGVLSDGASAKGAVVAVCALGRIRFDARREMYVGW